jgi:hypothetical protein
MKALPDKGNRRATSQSGSTPQRKAANTALKPAAAPTPFLIVRCPNPACGKRHRVKTSMAGKQGRCPDCGTLISIPKLTAPARDRPKEKSAGRATTVVAQEKTTGRVNTAVAQGKCAGRGSTVVAGQKSAGRGSTTVAEVRPPEELTPRDGPELIEVRAACIGRENAGKTALFRALDEGPVGEFFPSGLHLDLGDPREVARMIAEAEKTQRILQSSGLPPTLQASQIRYYLYAGEERRVVYKMREVIGQILTHTLPDSAAIRQTDYVEYLKSLVNTHVLWVIVPCPPPNPGSRERRRFANDLRITIAFLREALRLRTLKQPAAAVLVLSKIDTLFKDAEEARASLTDDVLRKALGPLVNLIDQSARVSNAAIIPVTAFGFDNAVLRESVGGRNAAPPESEDQPFGGEPIWLLREGVAPLPFNLDTLLLWTLHFGLLNQKGGGAEAKPETETICRMLREDLEAGDPWLVSIKG